MAEISNIPTSKRMNVSWKAGGHPPQEEQIITGSSRRSQKQITRFEKTHVDLITPPNARASLNKTTNFANNVDTGFQEFWERNAAYHEHRNPNVRSTMNHSEATEKRRFDMEKHVKRMQVKQGLDLQVAERKREPLKITMNTGILDGYTSTAYNILQIGTLRGGNIGNGMQQQRHGSELHRMHPSPRPPTLIPELKHIRVRERTVEEVVGMSVYQTKIPISQQLQKRILLDTKRRLRDALRNAKEAEKRVEEEERNKGETVGQLIGGSTIISRIPASVFSRLAIPRKAYVESIESKPLKLYRPMKPRPEIDDTNPVSKMLMLVPTIPSMQRESILSKYGRKPEILQDTHLKKIALTKTIRSNGLFTKMTAQ